MGSAEPLADPEPVDYWAQLTREDWQPGRVAEFTTSVPVKDMACEGPQTRIVSDPELTWRDVKARLHCQLSKPWEDPWLIQVAMQIQQREPDTCVLGVTATSALLLPVTMPKIRNLARMLSTDQNFLILNVSFYDALRSGFPSFGILDGLASSEYRAWFQSSEASQYFPRARIDGGAGADAASAGCNVGGAPALLAELRRGREASLLPGAPPGGGGGGAGEGSWRPPELVAFEFFGSAEAAPTPAPGTPEPCLPGSAAALLVLALARLRRLIRWQRGQDRATASREDERRQQPAAEKGFALRDAIELVSRAEEHIRNYSYQGVQFGELVASPWNLWWLLHQVQLALGEVVQEASPRRVAPWGEITSCPARYAG